ncbi:hypothetical protein B0H14DRAFT_2870159, partial [Mycena olivaceomarginata]
VKPCITNAPRMRVSSACLIALSLSPLLSRRLLSSSTADYPALNSLLCGSPWSDLIVRQRSFGSYLDMLTISSCARLRSGMRLSSVRPCTSAPRMRVTQRNVSWPCRSPRCCPVDTFFAGFLMRWATFPLGTQRLLRAPNYLDRWRHHPPLRYP